MKFKATIVGAEDLGRRAIGIGREMAKSGPLYPLERGLLAGGKIVAEEAKRRAPRRTGRGAESISARVIESRDGRVVVAIGPGRKEFYLMFHEIGFHAGANRKLGIKGQWIPAQPFLRPALDAQERNAITLARQVWRSAVYEYARRGGKEA